jgi:ligand-binding SRPBCC domain-containing protein
VTYRLQFEQWVPFPLDQVFLFFANPNNLPRIMPPAIGAKLLRLELNPPPASPAASSTGMPPLAGAGSAVVISVQILPFLPIRAPWVARIIEFEWNRHFVDVQEKGPFKSWHHRHQFAAETRNGINGTLVGDVVDYDLGFGPFGAFAQKLFVARQMQQNFTHRQKILESLLSQ